MPAESANELQSSIPIIEVRFLGPQSNIPSSWCERSNKGLRKTLSVFHSHRDVKLLSCANAHCAHSLLGLIHETNQLAFSSYC
ncbi:hypothetical protein O181_036509 [Austropuccinia psidii MF-1]|uniref:Uncharacterized protein n=1 Tax=Austropuccinia psidii MF-1 TaxID=1389203 RepID=A0A9Q3HBM1_9BASI|nr:hypothetical protein [Austropuccinia psidii MF-1]